MHLRGVPHLCDDAQAQPWDRGHVPGPAPTPEQAVVAVRGAVRRALAGLPDVVRAAPLLVACSGGPDSTALLAAARAVAPGRVHVAVVDHGLQDGSAERAATVVAGLVEEGVPAAVHAVDVTGPGGIEAAARRARYAALRTARPHPDSAVLLGHTLDDQAETVLLGLSRGSGARSLSGMATWDPPWLRPLLGLRRPDTLAACRAQGLPVWDDPHNVDARFTRVRLRTEVLPLLEDVLAGGVAEALVRTAAQLRDDDEALDAAATEVLGRAVCRNAELAVSKRETRAPLAHRERYGRWQTKIAVPGNRVPRSRDHWPHTVSRPSGHSGSTTASSTRPAATTSRTRSPRVRWCST